MGWEEFFDIYPFTQEREDVRMARLAELINNIVPAKYYKNIKSFMDFMPIFTDADKQQAKDRTLEQQTADDVAFGEKLKSIQNGN